jgi:hypothetical protein
MRYTVAIKPEAEETNLLDDGVDRYLGVNRRDERFLSGKICRYVRHAGGIFGEPIRTSNCALAWCGGILVLWSAAREGTAMENEFGRVVDAVATPSLIENWIDG